MKNPTPLEVAAMRDEAKLTQQAFGDLVHASAAAVQSWESGRRACPVNTWELLLVYFGKQAPRVVHPAHSENAEVRRLRALVNKIHTLTQ